MKDGNRSCSVKGHHFISRILSVVESCRFQFHVWIMFGFFSVFADYWFIVQLSLMEPELKFEGRKLQWKKLELPRTVYRELLEVS
jgi:hypothetical protein